MTIDEKIEIILTRLRQQTECDITAFYNEQWGKDDLELDEIKAKMLSVRMIKATATEGFYCITLLGERILANGGWVKFSQELIKNLESQKESEAEYAALKTANEAEKLENEAADKATLISSVAPTGSGGMSFKGVLLLISFLAAIAFAILFLKG